MASLWYLELTGTMNQAIAKFGETVPLLAFQYLIGFELILLGSRDARLLILIRSNVGVQGGVASPSEEELRHQDRYLALHDRHRSP